MADTSSTYSRSGQHNSDETMLIGAFQGQQIEEMKLLIPAKFSKTYYIRVVDFKILPILVKWL